MPYALTEHMTLFLFGGLHREVLARNVATDSGWSDTNGVSVIIEGDNYDAALDAASAIAGPDVRILYAENLNATTLPDEYKRKPLTDEQLFGEIHDRFADHLGIL